MCRMTPTETNATADKEVVQTRKPSLEGISPSKRHVFTLYNIDGAIMQMVRLFLSIKAIDTLSDEREGEKLLLHCNLYYTFWSNCKWFKSNKFRGHFV